MKVKWGKGYYKGLVGDDCPPRYDRGSGRPIKRINRATLIAIDPPVRYFRSVQNQIMVENFNFKSDFYETSENDLHFLSLWLNWLNAMQAGLFTETISVSALFGNRDS
jgi:hypothetical protein